MKLLECFKPTLALNLGLRPSFRSAVAGKPPGESNVHTYDSIQLSKTASSRTTSQVPWPNDNKAVEHCFHADRRSPAGQFDSGTKLERFRCREALLVSRNSSDPIWNPRESVLRKNCRLPRTAMKLTTACSPVARIARITRIET